MKITRILVIMLLTLSFSAVAVAQSADPVEDEQFGVVISPPADWELNTDDDKAVANFKHSASQSQIQVIGTELMNAEVADVFFNTFHKTLEESDFEQVSEEEITIGDIQGQAINYKFTHSGVTLDVLVFEFLRGETAWLVIGYIQDDERENYEDDYLAVIENIRFTDDD